MLAIVFDVTELTSMGSFLLVRHPRVMEKLRSEISNLPAQEGEITRADLRNLSYLQNILKESKSHQEA